MERQMKQCNKEYMKMAMLNQEETFKQQVHELHRLYRVQRQLMKDVKAGMKMRENDSTGHMNFDINKEAKKIDINQTCHSYSSEWKAQQTLDLKLQAEGYIVNDNQKVVPDIDEDLELTLAIGSNRKQRKKKETSLTSDSASSFSSSSTESAVAKTKSSTKCGAYQVPDESMRLANGRRIGVEFDERLRQGGMNQSSPFLQCLSLKMS